jgi:hypothetical protein
VVACVAIGTACSSPPEPASATPAPCALGTREPLDEMECAGRIECLCDSQGHVIELRQPPIATNLFRPRPDRSI